MADAFFPRAGTMTEGTPPPPKDFDARLRTLRERRAEERGEGGERIGVPRSAFGFALRAGIELVAGLVVGGGLGWLLDAWLRTGPFLMILFFFLGAAAGILNVFRVAQQINRAGPEDDR